MIVGPEIQAPQDVSLLKARAFHVDESVGAGQSDCRLDWIVRREEGDQLGRVSPRKWA
jgi:hypothetical protein